jgi:hypothetical protein
LVKERGNSPATFAQNILGYCTLGNIAFISYLAPEAAKWFSGDFSLDPNNIQLIATQLWKYRNNIMQIIIFPLKMVLKIITGAVNNSMAWLFNSKGSYACAGALFSYLNSVKGRI